MISAGSVLYLPSRICKLNAVYKYIRFGLKILSKEGLSGPEFYRNLVNKFREITGTVL